MLNHVDALTALRFQLDAGADEAIGELPIDRFSVPPPRPEPQIIAGPAGAATMAPPPRQAMAPSAFRLQSSNQTVEAARSTAAQCATLEELKRAMAAFDGCALRQTATNLVFADGNPAASLMLIGEAPGREEDAMGLPFVGESGQLLDRMLAAIGVDRRSNGGDGKLPCYITNILPWRPPGNRNPSDEEIVACLPFLQRHIELVRPKLLVFLGNISAKTLLNETIGITRLRGRWRDFPVSGAPVAAMPTYHPAFLLRQPAQKREAWRDFLAIEAKLRSLV